MINFNTTTPMMRQYLEIKSEYTNAILFYRMGDFYEMFFEDATLSAPILGIALTKRGQHEGADIPMCGVPFHSSENYISKLIAQGYKVAICEQLETPEEAKKRGYKAVVRREVVRVITAGTITEDNLLDSSSSNFLVAIASSKESIALSWADISTGEFFTSTTDILSLNNDLSRIAPKEILISDKSYQQENMIDALSDWKRIITIQANSVFELNKAEHKIRTYYNIATSEGLGKYSNTELIACGVVLEYIELTQKTSNTKIKYPQILLTNLFMSIDAATRRNLEINIGSNGEKRNSLINLLDRTKTSAGARLLSQYLALPLIDVEAINHRLNLVEFFLSNIDFTNEIRSDLSNIGDIERSLSRLKVSRGGPRDLQIIKQSLQAADVILAKFSYHQIETNQQLQNHLNNFYNFNNITFELESALNDELPLLVRDGGFIKYGYDSKLDHLIDSASNSKQQLQQLKSKYVNETGINNLKINYNNVLGYFVEVTPQNAHKINSENFIHRQSLANAVRYTTIELKTLESEIIHSKDNILKTELSLYENLVQLILTKSEELLLLSNSIATIDVAISFAYLAAEKKYTRPLLDNGLEFNISNGRHPVIENILNSNKQEFVENNCNLSNNNQLWLITGPNMAGKSTFLRQNALIAIMAQIGSYVPASSAHFGIIDKIFSRVGAADDLAKGRSTFMVEMVETANILNNATNRSMIILDEIGRGTSTYDGVSIAAACLEFIHNKLKSRALFATHYHELTSLTSQLPSLKCHCMQIKEWQNKIIFMHKIIAGIADKSYGIHVAELAGLPKEVIAKAQKILPSLEQEHHKAITVNSSIEATNNPAIEFINNLEIDHLSPKEALDILYKLKAMV